MAVKPQSLRHVTRSALAEFFNVSMPTVDTWVRSGCPFLRKGGRGVEWQFDTAAVAAWLRDRAVSDATGDTVTDETELRRRKLQAETTLAELELAKAKGEIAPIHEFERAQSRIMAAIQANVMNVPARAVLQLLGCTDETEFKAKLRAELTLALKTAAEAEITLDDEEGDDGSSDG